MSVVKINALQIPPQAGDEVVKRFTARLGELSKVDGFEGFELLKPTDERNTWLVITRWADEETFEAWVSSPAFGHGHRGEAESAGRPAAPKVAMSSELWSYEIAGGSSSR